MKKLTYSTKNIIRFDKHRYVNLNGLNNVYKDVSNVRLSTNYIFNSYLYLKWLNVFSRLSYLYINIYMYSNVWNIFTLNTDNVSVNLNTFKENFFRSYDNNTTLITNSLKNHSLLKNKNIQPSYLYFSENTLVSYDASYDLSKTYLDLTVLTSFNWAVYQFYLYSYTALYK